MIIASPRFDRPHSILQLCLTVVTRIDPLSGEPWPFGGPPRVFVIFETLQRLEWAHEVYFHLLLINTSIKSPAGTTMI